MVYLNFFFCKRDQGEDFLNSTNKGFHRKNEEEEEEEKELNRRIEDDNNFKPYSKPSSSLLNESSNKFPTSYTSATNPNSTNKLSVFNDNQSHQNHQGIEEEAAIKENLKILSIDSKNYRFYYRYDVKSQDSQEIRDLEKNCSSIKEENYFRADRIRPSTKRYLINLKKDGSTFLVSCVLTLVFLFIVRSNFFLEFQKDHLAPLIKVGGDNLTHNSRKIDESIFFKNPTNRAIGKNGVVSSEEERCSKIGIDVLKDNGTATDAAIATSICIGVVNFFSSGIGGGGFMVIKPPPCRDYKNCKAQEPISIDFRETSPSGSYYAKKFLKDSELSKVGGLSVGIPGELAGLHEAYRRFGGGVSWKRLFEPSVKLAQNFSVGPKLSEMVYRDGSINHSLWIRKKSEWSSILFPQNRSIVRVGDFIQRQNYAKTLRLIGDEGIGAFYSGKIAEELVKTINENGGRVSIKDFQDYRPIVRKALRSSYLNRTVWTTHAPSSGPMLVYLLDILENYSLKGKFQTPLNEHRFIEALKYTFSARTLFGDPKFLKNSEKIRIEEFISKAHAKEVFRKIDDGRTYNYEHYEPNYDFKEDHGTTHLSVVDRFGSTVALTSTVNLIFGSRVMDPKNGIVLNDENDDFSVPGQSNNFNLSSSPSNYIEKGKRPMSSIAPLIVDGPDGELYCSLGASGGSRIFSAIAFTLLKLDWGYDLLNAIDSHRIHHQLLPNEVLIEKGYPNSSIEFFRKVGHKLHFVNRKPGGKSAVQGILRKISGSDGQVLIGVSDFRKDGVPAAY